VSAPEKIVQHIASLPDLAMQRSAVGSFLEQADLADAVLAIDQILQASRRGRAAGAASALALAAWLIELRRPPQVREDKPEPRGLPASSRIGELRDAATQAALPATAAILCDAPAERRLSRLGRLPEALAPSRASIETPVGADQRYKEGFMRIRLRPDDRLLTHPSPIMARRLLATRWLSVREVLRMASRRPSSAAIAFEIASSDRWIGHQRVREALVQNPFTPTAIVLSLLPTIRETTLAWLAAADLVHPLVRQAAIALIAIGARSLDTPQTDC